MQDLEAINQQLRQLEEELQVSEACIKSITQNIPGTADQCSCFFPMNHFSSTPLTVDA